MSELNNSNQLNYMGPIRPNLAIDIILFILSSLGLILNSILFYLTLIRKGPKAIDVVLILVVAFFDSLLCLTLILSLIIRWCQGLDVLVSTSVWCKLNAIFLNASILSTLLGTALLALVRYLALNRRWQLSNKIWIFISLCLVGLLWITFTYRSITHRLIVLPSGLYCFPRFFGNDWETKCFGYMIQSLLYPSLIIIPICYIFIIIHFRRQFSHKSASFLHSSTLHLILTVIAYIVCVFPDYIHTILSKSIGVPRTTVSDGIVMTLTFSITIINALFALFMHDEINRDFKCLLRYPEPNRLSFLTT